MNTPHFLNAQISPQSLCISTFCKVECSTANTALKVFPSYQTILNKNNLSVSVMLVRMWKQEAFPIGWFTQNAFTTQLALLAEQIVRRLRFRANTV